jgi:hypothetical protein
MKENRMKKTTKKQTRRKYSKGDEVQFQGKRWIVCEGGMTDSAKKSYMYKISRGSWKKHIAGNCLKPFIG